MKRVRLLGLLSIAAALLLWSAAAADGANLQSRILRPGLNAIGWVGAEISADELLGQIPSVEAIYA